ncbi:unnamed protein product [Trifolium pratense]|uniref:Uncharacterized protein n=1 Tax=Trifolium pratense TaxID=57577 RepID=A0ACB0MEY9_TRIPR|nr:unnamed protein product [Trifolium pratense]
MIESLWIAQTIWILVLFAMTSCVDSVLFTLSCKDTSKSSICKDRVDNIIISTDRRDSQIPASRRQAAATLQPEPPRRNHNHPKKIPKFT